MDNTNIPFLPLIRRVKVVKQMVKRRDYQRKFGQFVELTLWWV